MDSKKNIRGLKPTPGECMRAVEYTKTAKHWVKEYLKLHSEYKKYCKSLLEIENKIESVKLKKTNK